MLSRLSSVEIKGVCRGSSMSLVQYKISYMCLYGLEFLKLSITILEISPYAAHTQQNIIPESIVIILYNTGNTLVMVPIINNGKDNISTKALV